MVKPKLGLEIHSASCASSSPVPGFQTLLLYFPRPWIFRLLLRAKVTLIERNEVMRFDSDDYLILINV